MARPWPMTAIEARQVAMCAEKTRHIGVLVEAGHNPSGQTSGQCALGLPVVGLRPPSVVGAGAAPETGDRKHLGSNDGPVTSPRRVRATVPGSGNGAPTRCSGSLLEVGMYLVGAAEQVVRTREDHNVRRPRAGRFPKPCQSGLHQTPGAPACSIPGQGMDATATTLKISSAMPPGAPASTWIYVGYGLRRQPNDGPTPGRCGSKRRNSSGRQLGGLTSRSNLDCFHHVCPTHG